MAIIVIRFHPQVIVERFGLFARFGFMHLVATNLALWVRTIIWESANEWIHAVYQHNKAAAAAGAAGVGGGGGYGTLSSLLVNSDGVTRTAVPPVAVDAPLALGLRSG